MRANSRFIASLLAIAAATTAFPRAVAADGPTSNVFFYTGNPDVDPDAYPLVGRSVPGYVTGIVVPFDGFELTVSRDSVSPGAGFTPQSSQVLVQVAPGTAYVLVNQIQPDRAVSFFGAPGVYDLSGAHATPNPGTFITPQRISFQTPDIFTTVEFSIDGGPFQPWVSTSSIPVVKTTTIAYRGTRGGETGPTKTLVYTIDSLPCSDVDGDGIPDRIEQIVGTDPFLAQGDANGNNILDLDELLRNAPTIVPASPAPGFLDSDGDNWSNLDEGLRSTSPVNPTAFPASPSLDTVELFFSGVVSPTSPGNSPPANPDPLKPYPGTYSVEVLTPGGIPQSIAQETDANYSVRTSGEQVRLLRAKALDGTGRQLLAIVPPRGLCVDTAEFCAESASLETWRVAYREQYDASIFHVTNGRPLDPRTTAAAYLLNRYYELETGNTYLPGIENAGPAPEIVFELRSARNEAELIAMIESAVTPEMIAVVTDYMRFATSPGELSMTEQLASIFSGQAIDPTKVPAGVRTTNFAPVATQTAAFFAGLPPAEAVLTGTILATPAGFQLTSMGTTYRLSGLADTFADSSTVTVRAIVDLDDCGESSPRARVTEVISRAPKALAAVVDSDDDGLDDDWEIYNFDNLDEEAAGDADGDGLSNEEEQENGTDPNKADPPIIASFQGDADLSLFVNATDLVFVQGNLGADYSCETCRGRGDANGNGQVTGSDLDSVGLNLFTAYVDDPGCVLAEVACNEGEFGKSLPELKGAETKGTGGSLTITGIPPSLVIGQEFEVVVMLDTGGSAIRAAGTRLTFPGGALEVLGGEVNDAVFDAWSLFKEDGENVDLAGLSTNDRAGILEFATIQLRAKLTGEALIVVDSNPLVTNIVQSSGEKVDGFTGMGGSVSVTEFSGVLWMFH